MKKPITLIGTYIKDFNEALDLAEKKSKNGQEFSVIAIDNGFLVANDKFLVEYCDNDKFFDEANKCEHEWETIAYIGIEGKEIGECSKCGENYEGTQPSLIN